MPTLTLEQQLAALNEAIASGERQVALGAQQVTYRSVSELIAARNELLKQQKDAAAVADVSKPTSKRTFLYQSGRGY